MRRTSWIAGAAVTVVTLIGCETATYVTSEVTGTAKPAGGIQQSVPVTRSFKGSPSAVRNAVLEVLDEQGYVYEENPSTGTIKTEPRLLTDQSKVIETLFVIKTSLSYAKAYFV